MSASQEELPFEGDLNSGAFEDDYPTTMPFPKPSKLSVEMELEHKKASAMFMLKLMEGRNVSQVAIGDVMAGGGNENPDGVAKQWFGYAFLGAIAYIGVVYLFVYGQDVGPDQYGKGAKVEQHD